MSTAILFFHCRAPTKTPTDARNSTGIYFYIISLPAEFISVKGQPGLEIVLKPNHIRGPTRWEILSISDSPEASPGSFCRCPDCQCPTEALPKLFMAAETPIAMQQQCYPSCPGLTLTPAFLFCVKSFYRFLRKQNLSPAYLAYRSFDTSVPISVRLLFCPGQRQCGRAIKCSELPRVVAHHRLRTKGHSRLLATVLVQWKADLMSPGGILCHEQVLFTS